jgi:hypothetical protein
LVSFSIGAPPTYLLMSPISLATGLRKSLPARTSANPFRPLRLLYANPPMCAAPCQKSRKSAPGQLLLPAHFARRPTDACVPYARGALNTQGASLFLLLRRHSVALSLASLARSTHHENQIFRESWPMRHKEENLSDIGCCQKRNKAQKRVVNYNNLLGLMCSALCSNNIVREALAL